MSLKRIDEIFHFEKGVLQSSKCIPGDYDFITASSDWKTHNEYTHECEALIFAAAASGSLGRTHYVNGKFVSSDLCFIITPKDQENLPVDLKFYHILFNELKDEIVRNTKAGTSKEAIGLGSFGKYKLPYFDVDKQIEIKNRFVNSEETKENLSTELTHQLTLVKKLRQQLLQDAVQGKLSEPLIASDSADDHDLKKKYGKIWNMSGKELLEHIKAEKEKSEKSSKSKKSAVQTIKAEEIPFEIPEDWVWCRLGEIFIDTFYGPRFSNSDYVKDGIPTIRTTDMSEKGIIELQDAPMVKVSSDSKIQLYKIQYNDLLITRTGSIGTMALFKSDYLAIPSAYLIRCRFVFNLMADYTFKLLKTDYSLNYFGLNTKTGTRPNINAVSISNLIIPLPPLSEQHRIIQKLDELMQTCDALEASIKESAAQNEKLLQQVLREALRKA